MKKIKDSNQYSPEVQRKPLLDARTSIKITPHAAKSKITIIIGPDNSRNTTRMFELFKQRSVGTGVVSFKVFNTENLHIGYDFLELQSKNTIPFSRLTALGFHAFGNPDLAINNGKYSILLSAYQEVAKKIDYSQPIWLDNVCNIEAEGGGFAPIIEKAMEMHSELILAVQESALTNILSKYFKGYAPEIINEL